jgi:hypothetical protein
VSGIADRVRRWTQDPVAVSCWVAVGLIVAAFGAFALAWRGAAATLSIPVQVSYLVSGGLGGLGLLVAGSALLTVQLGRRFAAQERAELDGLIAEAQAALDAVTLTSARG